jgi:hypothetical protein
MQSLDLLDKSSEIAESKDNHSSRSEARCYLGNPRITQTATEKSAFLLYLRFCNPGNTNRFSNCGFRLYLPTSERDSQSQLLLNPTVLFIIFHKTKKFFHIIQFDKLIWNYPTDSTQQEAIVDRPGQTERINCYFHTHFIGQTVTKVDLDIPRVLAFFWALYNHPVARQAPIISLSHTLANILKHKESSMTDWHVRTHDSAASRRI